MHIVMADNKIFGIYKREHDATRRCGELLTWQVAWTQKPFILTWPDSPPLNENAQREVQRHITDRVTVKYGKRL